MAHTYDAPLSPALKAYLDAFDAHLRAKDGLELVETRAAMVEQLFTATGRAPGTRMRGDGRMRRLRPKELCPGCGRGSVTPGHRCRSCSQTARRERERLAA